MLVERLAVKSGRRAKPPPKKQTTMNAHNENTSAPQTTTGRLYRADLEEMLRGPLANLFWGTIETSAVMEALERAESFVRSLELRQTRYVDAHDTPLLSHLGQEQAA